MHDLISKATVKGKIISLSSLKNNSNMENAYKNCKLLCWMQISKSMKNGRLSFFHTQKQNVVTYREIYFHCSITKLFGFPWHYLLSYPTDDSCKIADGILSDHHSRSGCDGSSSSWANWGLCFPMSFKVVYMYRTIRRIFSERAMQ